MKVLTPVARHFRSCSCGRVILMALVFCHPSPGHAQGGVAATVHNLSSSGPGEIKATDETRICRFCHVPHNAVVPQPLWGRALSDVHYEVPSLRLSRGGFVKAPQPDGSSRLCLSCHDGTIALGDLAGAAPIRMSGADRLESSHRGYIGTDISGDHPVSFEVEKSVAHNLPGDVDMEINVTGLRSDPDVKLDAEGKMQCTTCHDPHDDRHYQEGRTPHFWVKPTVEGVCMTCHVLR